MTIRGRARLVAGLGAVALALTFAPSIGAQEPAAPGEESFLNLEHIYNFSIPGSDPYVGTDLAFWTATVPLRDYSTGELVDEQGVPLPDGEPPVLASRDFAVMGNTGAVGGGYIFDITDPEAIELVNAASCRQARNDPSIVHVDGRVLLILADEDGGQSVCNRIPRFGDPTGDGIAVFDVTDPYLPEPMYSVQVDGGAHTATAHPTEPFVWISTGDLPGAFLGDGSDGEGHNHIPIVDFTDPEAPAITSVEVRLGGPHNVEFSPDGARAYVANENHYEIWDSTDPGSPTLISDTTVNVGTYAHGLWGTPDKQLMITNNESLALGGFFASGSGVCPGEGLGFYDTSDESNPTPVGYFVPPLVGKVPTGDPRACTSHFGNVAPNGHVMSVAWYIGGARVLDFSDPSAPTEVAHAVMADAESWSAKTYKGPYVYVGDIVRGFDVFKWTGDGPAPWETPPPEAAPSAGGQR